MKSVFRGILATMVTLGMASAPARADSPVWLDQIIYVLIPLKFHDGNTSNNIMKNQYQLPNPSYQGGYLGGDIAGIRQQVGYLKGLGINSILFYPMMKNDAKPFFQYLAGGYRPKDYLAVDPNYGTTSDLQGLITDLHSNAGGAARVNVILDLPLGMTGLEHPWYTHPNSYVDYYRPWNTVDTTQNIASSPISLPYGDVDNGFAMPIINHYHGLPYGSDTYAYLINILYTSVDSLNVDGFRYDSAQNFDARFWESSMDEFRTRYGASRPNFMHLGEAFVPFPKKDWQVYQDDFMDVNVHTPVGYIGLDSTYDFGLINEIQNVFAMGQNVSKLVNHINAQGILFEHPKRLVTSIDNYEDPTFKSKVTGGNASAKIYLALSFLLSINRVPLIYSGNEYGIDYTLPGQLFSASNSATFLNNFKNLVTIRKSHPALRRGSLQWLDTTATILSYKREYQGRRYIVILNNSGSSQSITIALGSRGIIANSRTSILNGSNTTLNNPGTGNCSLTVPMSAYQPTIVELL
jgi:alpha-amylase